MLLSSRLRSTRARLWPRPTGLACTFSLHPPSLSYNLPPPPPSGDSYTQTWFDPTGELPSTSNPIGNPEYPGWTASGGENWVTYLTTKYNTSLVFTYNYAYGGATTDAELVTPYEDTVLSFVDQVGEFEEGAGTKPAETPWTGEGSLFSVWIGVNDIGNSFWLDGDRGE